MTESVFPWKAEGYDTIPYRPVTIPRTASYELQHDRNLHPDDGTEQVALRTTKIPPPDASLPFLSKTERASHVVERPPPPLTPPRRTTRVAEEVSASLPIHFVAEDPPGSNHLFLLFFSLHLTTTPRHRLENRCLYLFQGPALPARPSLFPRIVVANFRITTAECTFPNSISILQAAANRRHKQLRGGQDQETSELPLSSPSRVCPAFCPLRDKQ